DLRRAGAAEQQRRDEQAAGAPRAAAGRHQPSLMTLRSRPTLLISTSQTSPGFMNSGGLRAAPTPPGVPVTITSPGCSVVKIEMYSISDGMSVIIMSIVVRCFSTPFTLVVIVCLVTSPTSSGVTRYGPKAPVATKFLPGVNWLVWRW